MIRATSHDENGLKSIIQCIVSLGFLLSQVSNVSWTMQTPEDDIDTRNTADTIGTPATDNADTGVTGFAKSCIVQFFNFMKSF